MEVIRPDEGPVSKTGDEATRLWVRVPRLPLRALLAMNYGQTFLKDY
jgi:hypothetical protein